MGPSASSPRQHLAIYDYGMGGIWILINAASAESIELRYPQLQVITIGNPEWVTEEKYSEIVDRTPPIMRFDLAHPSGWLADSDKALSAPRGDAAS